MSRAANIPNPMTGTTPPQPRTLRSCTNLPATITVSGHVRPGHPRPGHRPAAAARRRPAAVHPPGSPAPHAPVFRRAAARPAQPSRHARPPPWSGNCATPPARSSATPSSPPYTRPGHPGAMQLAVALSCLLLPLHPTSTTSTAAHLTPTPSQVNVSGHVHDITTCHLATVDAQRPSLTDLPSSAGE
jgi:hypothetical protein